jgi:chemotaxis signal transduction protein
MYDPSVPAGVAPAVDALSPLVLVRTGNALLAFESRYARSFAELPEEIPVPLTPAHIRGISLIAGQVIPLLDVARFLQIDGAGHAREDRHADLHRRVVVVSDRGMTVGIICEQIHLLTVDPNAVGAPGALIGGRLREFATAQIEHGDEVAAVIALGDLLESARVEG